jgi:hypothetical protein
MKEQMWGARALTEENSGRLNRVVPAMEAFFRVVPEAVFARHAGESSADQES